MIKNKICVIGSTNIDFVATMNYMPIPGETVIGKSLSIFGGGKGANQAVAAAKLGAKTSFISAIGSNDGGHDQIKEFKALGIDTTGISIFPDSPTGSAFIYIDNNGENSIVVIPGANGELRPNHIEAGMSQIANADLLLIQNEIPERAIDYAINIGKVLGKKVVYNPAPAKVIPPHWFKQIDLLIPNQSEARMLTGIYPDNMEEATLCAERLFSLGVKEVIITMGKAGCFHANKQETLHIEGFEVKAIDTVAAGDVFCAAVCANYEILPISETLRFANAAAAIAVTRKGAQSSVPNHEEVFAFMSKLK